MMTAIARHVRVSGLVQGVFFRAWTQQQAHGLGINGWVRNASDGSVEAHLQGEETAVQQLVELLYRGPPSARVRTVDTDPAELEEADRFEVRY